MEDLIQELIQKLFIKAYQINEKTRHTVFFEYIGHVNWIQISVYVNGWKDTSDADTKVIIDLKNDKKEVISKLIKVYEKLDVLEEEI